MKTNIILITLTIIYIITGCKKNSESLPDHIIYKELNKVIISPNMDSIDDVCVSMVFYFVIDQDSILHVKVRHDLTGGVCDAYYSIGTVPQTELICPKGENIHINDEINWYSSNSLQLDHFVGVGEKYIPYRICTYPSGTKMYFYGWILINLSQTGDTLTIISRATNNTEGNSILTGQTN